MSQGLVLKISINNEIKRIPVEWEPSLDELVILARERFGNLLQRPDFRIKYFDHSNDLVWVSSEDELKEAFKHACITEDDHRILRLYISPNRGATLVSSPVEHERKKTTSTPVFPVDVAKEIGWYGDKTREETEALLRGTPNKTFLSRWNKSSGCFVLSYVADTRISHIGFLYPLESGGVLVKRSDNSQVIYDRFEDYVRAMIRSKYIKEPRTTVSIPDPLNHTDYISFSAIKLDDHPEEPKHEEDFFFLDDLQFLHEGLLVHKEGEMQGKVIFSLSELPLNVRFLTENKNFVTRISETQVKFQSKSNMEAMYDI